MPDELRDEEEDDDVAMVQGFLSRTLPKFEMKKRAATGRVH